MVDRLGSIAVVNAPHHDQLREKRPVCPQVLLPPADETVANAIRIRGGGGAQVNRVASWPAQKTVGEVAKLAVEGNAEAKTAIKIIKDAARLAQK